MNIINQGNIRQFRVDKLLEHPDNPRKGDVQSVKDSITSNGFFGALIVQKSTNRVLAGNHRLKAARELKMDKVPVIFVDCDDDQARRILLADNRTSDLGSYDEARLLSMLRDVAQESDGLLGTGYTEKELSKLAYMFEGLEEEGDADIDVLITRWRVVVVCEDESQQLEVMKKLLSEGYECNALIS